jgi:hypothetical protein
VGFELESFVFLVVPTPRRAGFLRRCTLGPADAFAAERIVADARLLVATVAERVEEFSADSGASNSCARLVTVPAACPSLRATALRSGSRFSCAFAFFAAIDRPRKRLLVIGNKN